MKRLYFLPVLFLFSSFGFSQTVLDEGFETGNTNGLKPAGWQCGAAQKWVAGFGDQDHNRSPHSGSWYACFPWNSDAWMFKQVLLTAGNTYEFSMWYKTDGANGFQYEVKWGTDSLEAAMTNSILPLTALNNPAYQPVAQIFEVNQTGNYYIGIHGLSNNTPWYLCVDDIKLQVLENYNFELSSLSPDTVVYSGSYYDYKVKVRNTGVQSDVYDLEYFSNWEVQFLDRNTYSPISSIALESYASDTFIARQFVPSTGVSFGQTESTTVSLSSQNIYLAKSVQITSTAVCPLADFPYSQGFENTGVLPLGWKTKKITGNYAFSGISEGEYPSCLPHDNSNGMVYYRSFSASAGSTAILTSPPLSLQNEEYIARFWVYRTSNIDNKADKFEIYLSENEDLSSSQLLGTIHRAINFEPVENSDGWFEYHFTFSGNQTVKYIIFKAVSEYGWNMYIDDVRINRNLPDVAAPEFISISKTSQYANLPMPLSVVVRDDSQADSVMQGIFNLGNGDETFEMRLSEKEKGNYTYTGQIPPQANNTEGTVKFVMSDIFNNSAETSEFPINWSGIAPLLEDSFENEFPPAGWIILSEPLTWFIWSQVDSEEYEDSDGNLFTVNPAHGQKQAMVGWDFQENHQDEWLISPEVEITDSACLSFETFAQYGSMFYDHYVVAVSTNGINWQEVWDAFYLNTTINQYEEKVIIPLNSYIGQTIRVSWRAYNTVFENFWYSWFLDDIKIEKTGNVGIINQKENQNFHFEIVENPAKQTLNLRWGNTNSKDLKISIYNTNGNLVKSECLPAETLASKSGSFDISLLSPGVYVCELSNGEHRMAKRFVVLK